MLRIIWAAIKLLPRIIKDYFSWMIKNTKKIPLSKRYKNARGIIKKASKALKLEFIVEGKENLLDEPVLFVSNHLGVYDPLAIIDVLEMPTAVVAKKELKKVPLVGRIINHIDCQFIDRKDVNQSLKVMKHIENDFLNQNNKNWLIYPEGKRNKDYLKNMEEFHQGVFRPAINAKKAIQPIAIMGSFRALSTKYRLKKYPIYIKFLAPIKPEEYENLSLKEISDLAYERIAREVDYKLIKLDKEILSNH